LHFSNAENTPIFFNIIVKINTTKSQLIYLLKLKRVEIRNLLTEFIEL